MNRDAMIRRIKAIMSDDTYATPNAKLFHIKQLIEGEAEKGDVKKGWFATAGSWSHDKEETFCEDEDALKGFVTKHAYDSEVTLIRLERSQADT